MTSNIKHITHRLTPYAMLLLMLVTALPFLNLGGHILIVLRNTTLLWSLSAMVLIILSLTGYFFFDKNNSKKMHIISIYIVWNIICITRGLFVAETYWDWKGLTENSMILLLPLAAYPASNRILFQKQLSFYVRRVLLLFIFFFFILRADAYGFYLMPMSMMIFFFPILSKQARLLIILTTIVVLVSDLGARSNVIKFSIPILFLPLYYFKNKLGRKIMEIVRKSLFIIPIVLFLLGVSGKFNVFKIKEYLGKDIQVMGTDGKGERAEESLVADTRTFLYEEVLQSAINNDYWMFGRTPARGNDSATFGLIEFEWTGRYERLANEIGLANVFTWTGIVGVILFSLLLFHASYLAVNKSNNIFIKLIGIYVAFRYFYSWIEDISNFTLNYFMLWAMIGMCLSISFRNMTDKEITIWARGIFDIRYIHFEKFLIKKQLYEKSKNSCTADLSQ